MTSSGSARSVNAVKPRRSRNTAVISRRCGSSISAPPATMASATGGEKKRFICARRSIAATWSRTRSSSRSFHSFSSAVWRRTSSCSTLMRRSDLTRAKSSA